MKGSDQFFPHDCAASVDGDAEIIVMRNDDSAMTNCEEIRNGLADGLQI